MQKINYIQLAKVRLLGLVFVGVMLFATILPITRAGAQASGFNAGRIIDDSVFFNRYAMSSEQIQAFLNSKMPACDTNGNGQYSYRYNASPLRVNEAGDPYVTTTRAVYGQRVSDYWNSLPPSQRNVVPPGSTAPFTCINTFTQSVPGLTNSGSDLCSGNISPGTKTTAQIVYEVGVACGINPQVLLVMLQKEQSLITDTWPIGRQYSIAMGYGCPDTAPCDSEYFGFFNQVYQAAKGYKRYQANPGNYNYRSGRNNYIRYNPNAGCGGSNVYIQNQATANLYIYTPYQPNAAALGSLYGTGDGCSAYGNRNFWRMFNDWFGATTSDSSTDILSFLRLNHSSGHVEMLGLPSIGSYSYISRFDFSSYPAVPADGAVVPLMKYNGELSFVRLNHGSGNTEIVTYYPGGGYSQLKSIDLTGYPAINPDGAVKPLLFPNYDLFFIRLNHSSGHVELVSYSASSNYRKMSNYILASYPAVPADGSVIPLFKPGGGDLSFIRLNHSSGHVEIVSYSAASSFKNLTEIRNLPYPAVATDGSVIPTFKPNGDLSFIRLNHSSGKIEVVTYSAASNYQQLVEVKLTDHPTIPADGSVTPFFTRQ